MSTPSAGRLLAYRLAVAVVFLAGWEIVVGRVVDPFWFSSPLRIARYVGQAATTSTLYQHLGVTLVETILGFLLGGIGGIALGVILSRGETMAQVLDPFIAAVNGIPRVALAPLFIIWFGIGMLSKVFLAFTLVFFLTFYNTFSGLRSIDPTYQNIARVIGASEYEVFWKVTLPNAAPWILTGLKVSLPFALVGAIIGEFMAASRGLGFLIQTESSVYNTTGAMAGILILMVMVIVFNGLLTRIEARVLRWRPPATDRPQASELK
jgi:NitT/TauT family transport system permease protein